jgi:hypothetical protein
MEIKLKFFIQHKKWNHMIIVRYISDAYKLESTCVTWKKTDFYQHKTLERNMLKNIVCM